MLPIGGAVLVVCLHNSVQNADLCEQGGCEKLATHLIFCLHLRSISPLILHQIENLVHHIAWQGWHAAWAVCKGIRTAQEGCIPGPG